ncbi:unnamed protein product, partial [Brenthis ino]
MPFKYITKDTTRNRSNLDISVIRNALDDIDKGKSIRGAALEYEPSTTASVFMSNMEETARSEASSPSILTEEHSGYAILILEQSKEVATTSQLLDISTVDSRQKPKIILPEIIRPFPKSAPRKSKRFGRQPGKTKILTKTPEKQDLEQDHCKPKKMKTKVTKNKQKGKTKKRTVKRQVLQSSESETDLEGEPNEKLDNGLTATVNDYVDNTISMIIPFMQQNGLDPMELPDIEEGFEVRPIIITYSAWLRLTEGKMSGLVNVSRLGDQHVKYFAKMLRVRVQLQFTDLEFNYRYLVEVMNIGPSGGIIGSLDRFGVIADVLIDFNNDSIHLQQFSITDRGRLRVRLSGNIIFDWLLNPLIGVFTRLFNSIIMLVVELNIRNAAQMAIISINSSIADVVKYLESFNNN